MPGDKRAEKLELVDGRTRNTLGGERGGEREGGVGEKEKTGHTKTLTVFTRRARSYCNSFRVISVVRGMAILHPTPTSGRVHQEWRCYGIQPTKKRPNALCALLPVLHQHAQLAPT